MTLKGFYRWGSQNAVAAHVAGDSLPCAAELAESLAACGALDDLDTVPTADELAAYAQGWLDTAEGINAAAPTVDVDE